MGWEALGERHAGKTQRSREKHEADRREMALHGYLPRERGGRMPPRPQGNERESPEFRPIAGAALHEVSPGRSASGRPRRSRDGQSRKGKWRSRPARPSASMAGYEA